MKYLGGISSDGLHFFISVCIYLKASGKLGIDFCYVQVGLDGLQRKRNGKIYTGSGVMSVCNASLSFIDSWIPIRFLYAQYKYKSP